MKAPVCGLRFAVCGLRSWRFAQLARLAVCGVGLAVCAVGGLRSWRFARLAVGGWRGWRFAVGALSFTH